MAMKRGDRQTSLPQHPRYDWVLADRAKRSEKMIDTSQALYAVPQQVKRRVVAEGRRRYVAYDLNSLLAEGESGRPGHLFE